MPSRAQQMTPGQMYGLSGSRWRVPLKVLTNKRALDAAFMQHTWKLQSESQKDKANREQRKDLNVITQAVKLAQDQGLDLNTYEGQQEFQTIYQVLLNQASGGESGAMMGGPSPNVFKENAADVKVNEPVASNDWRRALPQYQYFGIPSAKEAGTKILTPEAARKILSRVGENIDKAIAVAKKLGYTGPF